MSLQDQARVVERDIFGALIGTLSGVMVCRVALLAVEVNVFLLIALLAIGAWSGGFIAHAATSRSEAAIQSLRTWAIQFRRVCLRTMLWLFGAASVIAAYVLVTPSIWNLGHRGEEMALAGLIVTLMLPFGLVVMMLIQTEVARVAGVAGLGLYASVLIIFLTALWSPNQWYRNDEWWETGFALAGYGAAAMASLVGVAAGDRRYWRWLGVLAAVLGWALCTWGIWTDANTFEDVLVVITSVAIVVAHANLAMFVPLGGGQVWLRVATIGAVAIAAFCLDVDIVLSLSKGGQISAVARVALAAGILASCGSLALIVLACLNRIAELRSASGPITTITIVCPQCGKRQALALAGAACSGCGLRIHIRVEAPGNEGLSASAEPAPTV